MIDWDKEVLAPLHSQSVFGEPITYKPVEGSPFPITGVFDEAYREVDLAGGTAFSSLMPVLGVRLAEFGAWVPRQGDRFVVESRQREYIVKEPQPDGHGEIKLMSNLVGPA